MYLVTAGEMQEMDGKTIQSFGIPGRVLMESAGRGAAETLWEAFPDLPRKKVAVVAGRGNNGGDGFVIARYLAGRGVPVTVFLLSTVDRVQGDAASNLALLNPLGIPVVEMPDHEALAARIPALRQQELWVDAIFGTGLNAEVKGFYKDVIEFINGSGKPVFAVDIPSGLHADTGQPLGTCIAAAVTATFGLAKIGQAVFPGAGFCGRVKVVDIGIPSQIVAQVDPRQWILTHRMIRDYYRPRPMETHKGRTGHLLVLAASPGRTGAAFMTSEAALRTGAGLVTLGLPQSLNPVAETRLLEAMTYPLPETEAGALSEDALPKITELLSGKVCLALGPGIGTGESTRQLVFGLLKEISIPAVIDADGLNCLSGRPEVLREVAAPVVLTPHPGEMARLVNARPAAVQKDRIRYARQLARDTKSHVVLKGARTLVAHPDGRLFVNPTGNPGMASGGMGDVLTGMIAGFVTQGYEVETACHLGVFLHGAAADRIYGCITPQGYLASDVIAALPDEIRRWPDQEGDEDGFFLTSLPPAQQIPAGGTDD